MDESLNFDNSDSYNSFDFKEKLVELSYEIEEIKFKIERTLSNQLELSRNIVILNTKTNTSLLDSKLISPIELLTKNTDTEFNKIMNDNIST